jgi:hypothetical protein
VCWEVIDEVGAATRKPAGEARSFDTFGTSRIEPSGLASKVGPLAAQIILQPYGTRTDEQDRGSDLP